MGVPHYFRYYYRHGLSGIINLSPVAVYNIWIHVGICMCTQRAHAHKHGPAPAKLFNLWVLPTGGGRGGGGAWCRPLPLRLNNINTN